MGRARSRQRPPAVLDESGPTGLPGSTDSPVTPRCHSPEPPDPLIHTSPSPPPGRRVGTFLGGPSDLPSTSDTVTIEPVRSVAPHRGPDEPRWGSAPTREPSSSDTGDRPARDGSVDEHQRQAPSTPAPNSEVETRFERRESIWTRCGEPITSRPSIATVRPTPPTQAPPPGSTRPDS